MHRIRLGNIKHDKVSGFRLPNDTPHSHFHIAGFLAMMALGKDVAESVKAGHFAARTIIQRSGCTFPKECNYV
jgi:hypothetical protein